MNSLGIDEIRIPLVLSASIPSEKKLEHKKAVIQSGASLSVTVSTNNYLIDGYITYLAYKDLRVEEIPCIYSPYDYIEENEDICRIPQRVKISIYDDAHGKCYICGRKGFRGDMTIDHVIPKSKGGSDSADNLRCCCKICNMLKASFTYSPELVQVIRRELKERGLLN